MTSPFISRPEATNDKYNDVHSHGSTYGQDLKSEAQVRALLSPRIESPFQRALNRFSEFAEGLIGGIADAIRGEGGASYKAINVAVNERLGPINTLITETGERHKELANKVDESIEKQEGINTEQGKALKDADAAIQALKDYKAEVQEKVQSSIDTAKGATAEAASLREELSKLANGLDARIEQSQAAKDLQAKFDQLNNDFGSKVDTAVESSTKMRELSEQAKTTLDAVMNPIDIGTSLVSINPVTKVPYWAETATEVKDLTPPVAGARVYSFQTRAKDSGVTSTMGGMVTVDPRLEYEVSFWLHIDTKNTRTVIEFRDQDGNHAVKSGSSFDDSQAKYSNVNYIWWSPPNMEPGWYFIHQRFRLQDTVSQAKLSNIYWHHTGGTFGRASICNLNISPLVPSQATIDAIQNELIEANRKATEANTKSLEVQKELNKESAKWKVETEDWKAKKDEFEKTSREFQKTQAKVEKLQTQTDDAQNKALELLNKPELNGSLVPMVPNKGKVDGISKYEHIPEYFVNGTPSPWAKAGHFEITSPTSSRGTQDLKGTPTPCAPGGKYEVEFRATAWGSGSVLYLELRDAKSGSHAVKESSLFSVDGGKPSYGNKGSYAIPGVRLTNGDHLYKGTITLKDDVESVYISRIYWNHGDGSVIERQAMSRLKIYQPIPSQAEIDEMQNKAIKLGQDFDKEQIKTNRLVQEQLWNHQDTLEFLDIRSPKSYGYNTKVGTGTSWTKTKIPYERFWNSDERAYYNPDGYYNKDVSPFVTVLTKQGDKVAWVVCKGKWEGSFNISLNWTNGAVDNWSVDLTKSGPRVFQFDGGALTIHIRQITVTVMPTCLNREVTVNFADYDTVQNNRAFTGDFSLVRERRDRRDLRFSAPVKCNEPINVQDSDGGWSKVPAGTVISGKMVSIYYTNVKNTFTEVWEYDKNWDKPRGNDWSSHDSNTPVEKFEVG